MHVLRSPLLVLFALGAIFLVGSALMRDGARYREALSIGHGAPTFEELEQRFQTLARERGAVYAYEVLRRAELPSGTDLHLLGHVVGDELYLQEGLDGIAHCTPEFRNACSHTIVIGALTAYGGEDALEKIRDACRKAPGGNGAYTMCYHGLGHGVLAYFGYELEPTVDFCRKTATDEYGKREYAECVGGAVMELMGGGGHDRHAWEESRERYLSSADPLYPCTASWFPEDSRVMCLVYITPHLFEVAGASLSLPLPEHFAAAFRYCDTISRTRPELRDACFGGIGKEFPVLAMDRDIRQIERATDAQLERMRGWCALAPHDEAKIACERAVLESLFWGGENDSRLSLRYCARVSESEVDFCWEKIAEMTHMYLSNDRSRAQGVCASLPEAYARSCTDG